VLIRAGRESREDRTGADGSMEPTQEVGVTEVRAEMVANVSKIVAIEGDPVQDGDTLVILESMKMEIPVLAEAGGLLRRLTVAEGQVVQEGDLIAVIDET
jgi:biotin carboxyl carrier protein